MRTARIVVILAIGVAYVFFSAGYPEYRWYARGTALLAVIAVGAAFRKAGAPAGDPMTPEPIQSLNLADRQMNDKK